MAPTLNEDFKLSVVSKKWDVEDKGFLSEEQLNMRKLDTTGTGSLSAKQLAPFLAHYKSLQQENKKVKQGLVLLAVLSAVFFAGTVVASVFAARANRVVEINSGILSSKDSGSPVSTNTNEVSIPFGALAFVPTKFVSHVKQVTIHGNPGVSYHRSVAAVDVINGTSIVIMTTAGDSLVWPSMDGIQNDTTFTLNNGTSMTMDASCSCCAATSVIMTDEVEQGVEAFFDHIGYDTSEENEGGRRMRYSYKGDGACHSCFDYHRFYLLM